jgi:replicative DNA helicase
MRIETSILSNLVNNEDYTRKVFPYIKKEYFMDGAESTVFHVIKDYFDKYNKRPLIQVVQSEIEQYNLNTKEYEQVKSVLESVKSLDSVKPDLEWLVDTTEQWCQTQAIHGALLASMEIIDDEKKPRSAIPQLLQDALAISFDSDVGLDFYDHADYWYDLTHSKLPRIPFGIDYLNKITKGGLLPKTLNIIIGGVGFGKSLWMCHLAGDNLMQGKKVLYITMELSREQTMERIYANMLNISLDMMPDIPKEIFLGKVEKLKEKTAGQLKVAEYPTGTAGAANFRHLLNELKVKQGWVPDIIYIDYLNICCSSRVKLSGNLGMYNYVKSIAEEIRALAVEQSVPIISASQVNREGFRSSDPGMDDISESFGLAATADLIIIIILSDELIALNQYMVKQGKNRYADVNRYNKFVVGVDKPKMRLYNVEKHAQSTTDEEPIVAKMEAPIDYEKSLLDAMGDLVEPEPEWSQFK